MLFNIRRRVFSNFDYQNAFLNGWKCIQKDGKWGFVDQDRKRVVECKYSSEALFTRYFDEKVSDLVKKAKFSDLIDCFRIQAEILEYETKVKIQASKDEKEIEMHVNEFKYNINILAKEEKEFIIAFKKAKETTVEIYEKRRDAISTISNVLSDTFDEIEIEDE